MKKTLLLAACLMLATFSLFSQQTKVIEGKQGMYPSFVSFAPEARPAFSKGRLSLTDLNARITSSVTAKIAGQEKDMAGAEHIRYQQTINGIPVEQAIYIVHTRGGAVFAQNGKWIKDIPS